MRILVILLGAFFLLGLAVLGLSIGKILSGKNRLRKGCGMTPDDKEKCQLCGRSKQCKEEDDKDKDDAHS